MAHSKKPDLMKIETEQKTNPVSLELDAKGMIQNIILKLRENTLLNMQERKALIKAFEIYGTSIFTKRNSDQTNMHRPELISKKMQVNIPVENRDVFTQTDPLIIPFKEVRFIKNVDDGEDAKNTLKRLCVLEEVPLELINTLMEKTYENRRNFIQTGPAISIIKEQWPALFCVEQVKKELDRLFYPGKCEEFLENMYLYTKHIFHYKSQIVDDILETVDNARSQAKTTKQKRYAETVGSIFVHAKQLDDNFGFIHLSDQPHSSSDLFPYIDASLYSLQTVFFEGNSFNIIVEGKHLCEASNFLEAILCLMATFFIFSIDYPKSCRRTLTVLEKLYLKGNDTQEMDDMTQQWIKLLTMKETRKRKREKEKF